VLRFASLVATALVLAGLSAPASAANFSGTWATVTDQNGHYQLTLLQGQSAVVGTFDETNPVYSGTLEGTLTAPGRFEFTYVQPTSGGKGTGWFELSADGRALTGGGSTSDGVAFAWAGTRTAKGQQAASNAETANRFAALDKKYQAMAVAAAKADPADWQKTAALHDGLQSDLDSMSELGETESLRLQMAMDRMSKMMTTLSNILKKISDTNQSIIQNIK
jgi:hypothetical protein